MSKVIREALVARLRKTEEWLHCSQNPEGLRISAENTFKAYERALADRERYKSDIAELKAAIDALPPEPDEVAVIIDMEGENE